MPDIYSSTNDGECRRYATESWSTCRSSNVSNTAHSTSTAHFGNVQHFSGRGATVTGIPRIFFDFDTSGISVAPSSATLKLYGYSGGTSDVIIIRSTQSASLATSDYEEIYNASTELGNSDGSGAGSLNSISGLKYSAEISIWSTSGYNSITLNSDALSDMASLSNFKCCLMNYDYDFLDVAPSLGTNIRAGIYSSNYTGTSRDPYIDYTAGVATVTQNATFFGANF